MLVSITVRHRTMRHGLHFLCQCCSIDAQSAEWPGKDFQAAHIHTRFLFCLSYLLIYSLQMHKVYRKTRRDSSVLLLSFLSHSLNFGGGWNC